MEAPAPDAAAPLPPHRWSLEKPKLLIVEGKDERLLLPLLMVHHGISGVQVEDIGGKTLLQRNLRQVRLQMEQTSLSSIGILRDADDDPARAFQSVCSALSANGFTPPLAPGVFTDDAPRIGVFILPAARTEGALETLCLRSLGDDSALECMSDFFECIGGAPNNTTAGQVAHAQAQVYLASRFCGISQAGRAAEAECWDFASSVWNPLKSFLSQL